LTRHLSKEFWKGIGERVDGRGEEKKGIGEGSPPSPLGRRRVLPERG